MIIIVVVVVVMIFIIGLTFLPTIHFKSFTSATEHGPRLNVELYMRRTKPGEVSS